MDYAELAVLVGALLAGGLLSGFMAGLLGVGGGITMVPILFQIFIILGVPEALQMHMAVGTSLAVIAFTSTQSARAHAKRDAIDLAILKFWSPFIMVGAVAGALIIRGIPAVGLKGMFAILVFVLALRFIFLPQQERPQGSEPFGRTFQALVSTAIGFLSALVGIGGGTFSVPFLSANGLSIHRAVGTSAALGFFIALPAAAGFMWAGAGLPDRPVGSIGYVSVIAFLIMIPATSLGAPWGAASAHRLSRRTLELIFGGFLLLVSIRMIWALAASLHWIG